VSDRRKQRAVAAPMKRATGSHRPETANPPAAHGVRSSLPPATRLEFFSDAVFAFAATLAGVGVLSIATAAAGIGVRYGVPGFLYGLIGPLSWWHGAWSDRRAPR